MENDEHIYSEAIEIYRTTQLSVKEICQKTKIKFSVFISYLSTYHRELILVRHRAISPKYFKYREQKGQTVAVYHKYKDAIAACESEKYIEYNISQIARIFSVGCSSLANQLRRYYPDIIPRREQVRRALGIYRNLQYGVRTKSKEMYSTAAKLLQFTNMTIEEAAYSCNVSYSGLREHILAYYPQITNHRKLKRTKAKGCNIKGQRSGNWGMCNPKPSSIYKYKNAIELYKSTTFSIAEIARVVGVNSEAFRYYLKRWHSDLIAERSRFGRGDTLSEAKCNMDATFYKYAAAIDKLRTSDMPISRIAIKFGLNPGPFRVYIKKHYPDLYELRRRVKTINGHHISNYSESKYATAIHIYETTPESLKSISKKLGLVYNSLGGYIRRNHPDAIVRHNALLKYPNEKNVLNQ